MLEPKSCRPTAKHCSNEWGSIMTSGSDHDENSNVDERYVPIDVKQNSRDLVQSLRSQLRHIETSINAFNRGDGDEAVRIALAIRVLLHDTRNGRSLLGQLGWKDRLRFRSTPERTIEGDSWCSLVRLETADDFTFAPFLDDISMPWRSLTFEQWWHERVLYACMSRCSYTREQITLHLANKEGGAHVDPELPPDWESLTSGPAFGAIALNPTTLDAKWIVGVERACIVQMAHEVRHTLYEQVADLKIPKTIET
jgi:hypothetical protein